MGALGVEPGSVVLVRGRLDVSTAPDIRPVLHAALDSGTGDLVLDLSEVLVIDSTGLGLLVGVHRRAGRCGRRLVLRGVSTPVRRLLRRTRLHLVLHVEDSAVPVA